MFLLKHYKIWGKLAMTADSEKVTRSESFFRFITENSNDLIAVVNHKNEYQYVNEEPHMRILGYPKDDLIGKSIAEFIHPAHLNDIKELVNGELLTEDSAVELRVKHQDGYYLWIESRARFLMDENDNRMAIVISRDVTERKKMMEELKTSKEKFRQVIENAHEGIWIIDEEGINTYVNQQMANILGFDSPEEFVGRSLFSFLDEERKKIMRYYIERRRRGIKEILDFKTYRRDGKRIYLRIKTSPIFDDQGEYIGALGFVSDITEQILTEYKLRESEEQFKLMAEQSIMGIIIIQDGVIKYANQAAETITGYPVQEMKDWLPNGFARLIYPGDVEIVSPEAQSKQLGRLGVTSHYYYRIMTQKRKIKWISQYSKTITFQGKLADLVTLVDITERRIAEQKQRESEEKFKTITEQSLMGIGILQDGCFKYVNEEASTITEYSIQEILDWEQGAFIKLLHPDDRAFVMEQARRKQVGESDVIDHYYARFYTKSGKLKWLSVYSKTITYQGKFADLITLIDITERKVAEQKQLESEEKFKIIAEQSQMGIVILQDQLIKYANEGVSIISGFSIDEILNWKAGDFIKFVFHDDASFVMEQARKKQAGEPGAVSHYYTRFHTKTEKLKWISIYSKSIKYQGRIADLVTIIDITERKNAESEAEKSRGRLRYLLGASPAIIYSAKPEGDYPATFISENVNLMTGYEAYEFTNNPSFWSEHIHPKDKDRVFEEVNQLFKKNRHSYEYRFKCKDGNYKWLIDSMELLYDIDGKPMEIVGYWADITDRKLAETRLLRSEERYRRLVETMNEGLTMIDSNGVFTYINKKLHELLGYASDEINGKHWREFFNPEYQKIVENHISKRERGEASSYEVAWRKKDGQNLFSIISGRPFYNESGEYEGSFAVVTDITDRKSAEQKLRESEEKYRFIIENVNDLIVVINAKSEVEYYNEECVQRILGFPIEELIGQDLMELIHPDDREHVFESFVQGSKLDEERVELRFPTKEGSYKWFEAKGRTFIDKDGELKAIIVARDINERKEADQRLKESEEKYRFITENMDDVISVLDKDLKIEFINEALERMSGFKIDDVISKPVAEFIHPDDLEQSLKVVETGLKTGVGSGEFRIKKKDSSYLGVEVKGKVIFDKNNKQKFILVNRDIEVRKRLEQELRDSEELYKTLLKTSPDAVTVTDLQGNITALSERTLKLNRYSNIEEIIGTSGIKYLAPKDHERAMRNQEKVLTDEVVENLEYTFLRKDGTSYIGEINISVLKDSSGKPKGFIATTRDITERKRAEEKLRKSEEQYREAYNRAEFYKDLIAHDVTNILQNIVFAAESGLLLLDEREKLKGKLVDIKDQVKRSGKLISNVRKLSKLEKESPLLQLVDVKEVLTNTTAMIQRISSKKEMNIQIEVLTEKVYIQGNELLRDVFENVLQNAVKFNQNSTVEVFIRVSSIQEEGKRHLKLEFMDNGLGIREKNKWAIFERGYRVNGKVGGRGLGLSLVKKIVNSYNGQIWVEDRVEGDFSQGSNFIIEIPEANPQLR